MKTYKIAEHLELPGDRVFFWMDTKGIPLEIICIMANEKGLVIGWSEFFKAANLSGNFKNKLDKFYERAKQASIDAGYNNKWWSKWIEKQPQYYKEE